MKRQRSKSSKRTRKASIYVDSRSSDSTTSDKSVSFRSKKKKKKKGQIQDVTNYSSSSSSSRGHSQQSVHWGDKDVRDEEGGELFQPNIGEEMKAIARTWGVSSSSSANQQLSSSSRTRSRSRFLITQLPPTLTTTSSGNSKDGHIHVGGQQQQHHHHQKLWPGVNRRRRGLRERQLCITFGHYHSKNDFGGSSAAHGRGSRSPHIVVSTSQRCHVTIFTTCSRKGVFSQQSV